MRSANEASVKLGSSSIAAFFSVRQAAKLSNNPLSLTRGHVEGSVETASVKQQLETTAELLRPLIPNWVELTVKTSRLSKNVQMLAAGICFCQIIRSSGGAVTIENGLSNNEERGFGCQVLTAVPEISPQTHM